MFCFFVSQQATHCEDHSQEHRHGVSLRGRPQIISFIWEQPLASVSAGMSLVAPSLNTYWHTAQCTLTQSTPTWHPPPRLQVTPGPLGHHVGAAIEGACHHAAGVKPDCGLKRKAKLCDSLSELVRAGCTIIFVFHNFFIIQTPFIIGKAYINVEQYQQSLTHYYNSIWNSFQNLLISNYNSLSCYSRYN